jgi:hypothetical protein
MRLRAILAFITLLLLIAAPMQAERCAMHCASAMNGAGSYPAEKHGMTGPHAHCTMSIAASGSTTSFAKAPGSQCHEDCGIAAKSICPRDDGQLTALPSANYPEDSATAGSASTVNLPAFSPPIGKAMYRVRSSSGRLPLPAQSLSISFRV